MKPDGMPGSPWGMHVPLRREYKQQLIELARQERRRPQDQAAILIEKALQGLHEASITDVCEDKDAIEY